MAKNGFVISRIITLTVELFGIVTPTMGVAVGPAKYLSI